MSARDDLLEMIDTFLSGRDRSMELVNRIESLLITDFLDTGLFEELTEPLSLYRPGAGNPYVDEQELADSLAQGRAMLKADGASLSPSRSEGATCPPRA